MIAGRYTPAPDRCDFVSAELRMTFGSGAAGAGDTMLAIVTVSALSPWSICKVSPTTRPVVLASLTLVAPGDEAAWSVVG
jgi:hypothetical protein